VASMGGTQRVACFDRRLVVAMAVIKGRRLNTSRYVASLVAGAHIPRHKLGWCASIIMRKAGTADTRRTEERLFGASVSPMAGVGVPAAVEAEAQTRGLAWHSVPCVTCCPMCADGDADALCLWRGILLGGYIPVHCRGGGFADAGSGFCVAVGKRPPTESLHSLASGPCPPVRGGPLAPCPVARSCRTEREPPIPPKLQTRTGTLLSVNVM
jgi:hypothetical protein